MTHIETTNTMPTEKEYLAHLTTLSIGPKTKGGSDGGDDERKKKPKKSKVPTATRAEPNDDDDGNQSGDDEQVDAQEQHDESDNLYLQLRNFSQDREFYRNAVYLLLSRWFGSFSTDKPGAGIRYNHQVAFHSILMQRLRKAPRNAAVINFVFTLVTHDLNLMGVSAFTHTGLLADRIANAERDILIFSTADLACLASALKAAHETLEKAKTRKTGDKSRPQIEAVIEHLTRIRDAAKTTLRSVIKQGVPLESVPMLYCGEPLHAVVDYKVRQLGHAEETSIGPQPVALYYDFAENRLAAMTALDVDVPNAASLDAAFASMLDDENRIVLRDLRTAFKERRGWESV